MVCRSFRSAALLLTLLSACAADPGAGPGNPGDGGGGPDGKGDDPGSDGGSTAPRLILALDASVYTRSITDSDVDCFWDKGYRHLIVGTQMLEVSREQLAIATRGGMTVDLYVYLNWDRALDQVAEAVALGDEFPLVGTIWLDVEDTPLANQSIPAILTSALALASSHPMGIYTSRGFWTTYVNDTHAFTDVPLWYARYDLSVTLDDWNDPAQKESFGGWVAPVGKQWDDHIPGTCGRAVDKDLMLVSATPSVDVDRTVPPDDGNPPPAPVALVPDGGIAVHTEYVRPTAPTIRQATSYQLELEVWSNSAWVPYWKPKSPVSSMTIFPVLHDKPYRWRIRGVNGHGPGPWSAWAWFDFGEPKSDPPADQLP